MTISSLNDRLPAAVRAALARRSIDRIAGLVHATRRRRALAARLGIALINKSRNLHMTR